MDGSRSGSPAVPVSGDELMSTGSANMPMAGSFGGTEIATIPSVAVTMSQEIQKEDSELVTLGTTVTESLYIKSEFRYSNAKEVEQCNNPVHVDDMILDDETPQDLVEVVSKLGSKPNDNDADSALGSMWSVDTQGFGETACGLLQDPEFHNTLQTAKILLEKIVEWLPVRESTVGSLKDIQKVLEESYHKRTISKVSGASAAIVGSTIAIVGFGLSFVTLGASLSLSIVGGAIAAAGGITMGGADIGNAVVSKSQMKKVATVIEQDRELSTSVRELAEQLSKQVEELSLKYPSFSRENILTIVSHVFKGGQAGKVLYDGYKLLDAGYNVISTFLKMSRVAGTGVSAARIAWTGLKTVAGGLSVAGVIFDAVSLPFDVIVLVKGSYDIHKYKSGKGSNSNHANKVEKMIEQLEDHKTELLQLRDMFEVDDSDHPYEHLEVDEDLVQDE